jgi:hypothetical protein
MRAFADARASAVQQKKGEEKSNEQPKETYRTSKK